MASLRKKIGDEISEHAKLQAEIREMATRQMIEFAELLGADTVVSGNYKTSMIPAGASEIFAYGTAVKFRQATSYPLYVVST